MLPTEDPKAIAETTVREIVAAGWQEFMKDGELRAALLTCMSEAGCKPPLNHVLLVALDLLARGATALVGAQLIACLTEHLVRLPILSKIFENLAKLTREGKAKAEVIKALRETVKLPDGAPVPDEAGLDLIAALRTDQRLSDIQNEIIAIRAWLQDEEDRRCAPRLAWLMQAESANQTLTEGLKYNSGRDAFVGREDLIEVMEAFCGDPAQRDRHTRFRWMTLTGDGGQGKTRFALEFTARLEARAWRAGRLSFEDLEQFNRAQWRPVWPTFIVIDYAAQRPDRVKALLASIAAAAQESACAPVRVLLLERTTAGEWFKTFEAADSDAAAVRSYGWAPGGEEHWRGRRVEPLASDEIVKLMQARLRAVGAPEFAPETLLEAAFRVDPRGFETDDGIIPLPRPLFALGVAALAADAHTRGEDAGTALAALKPEAVLRDILQRDRERFWLPAAGGQNNKLAAFENLAALATLTGGISADTLGAGAFGFGDWLPEPPGPQVENPFESPVLKAMGLARDGGCAPLEPDLLGARFVFDRLAALKHKGCDGAEALVVASWRGPFPHALPFALRALRDAPADLDAWDFLTPPASAGSAPAENWSKLVVNLSNVLGGAGDWDRFDAAFAALDAMRSAFPADAGVALQDASACVNAVGRTGAAGEWARFDAAFARLDGLRARFPIDTAIGLHDAKACVNAVNQTGAVSDWVRLAAAFTRLDGLRATFPADAAIALMDAMACLNAINHAGKAGDWARCEVAFTRLDRLRAGFPVDAAIALHDAQACVNTMSDTSAAGDWARFETAFARLDGLRAVFPADAAIALADATACMNAIGRTSAVGDWVRFNLTWEHAFDVAMSMPNEADVIAMAGQAAIRAAIAVCATGPLADATPERLAKTAYLARLAIMAVKSDRAEFVVGPGLVVIKTAAAMLGEDTIRILVHWAQKSCAVSGIDWAAIPLVQREAGEDLNPRAT